MAHACSPTISRFCHTAPDCPEDSEAAQELQKLKVRSPRAFLKVMRILHFLLLSFLVIETASLR